MGFATDPKGWIDTKRCVRKFFCLFANQQFAGGQGIAFISTRENFERIKEIVERSSASHEGGTVLLPEPFHSAQIKGKGMGLVADKPLRRGARLMSMPPVFIAHRNFLERVPPDYQGPLLDLAVDLLPPSTRAVFLSQMTRFAGNRAADIMATNSFQMNLGGEDGHHFGNYPAVSRFNHDCRPNVAFHIDGDLVHTTTVVRDIKPGEELTVSYLDNAEPRALRQIRARQTWGFECACSQCSLPESLVAKSDRRLEEISQIADKLTNPQGGEVTPALIRRFIKLHEDERLDSTMATAYSLAALNFYILKDEKMAMKYAKLAVEAGTIESGPESQTVKSVKGLIQNLTQKPG